MLKKSVVILLSVMLSGCGLLDNVKPKQVPQVTTNEASLVDESGFTGSGTVVNTGGLTVTERGIVVGLSVEPTTGDLKFTAGSGTGSFSTDIIGLQPATTYHFRAYAVNSKGAGYGEDRTVTTASGVPVLSTGIPTSIGAFSASVPVTISSGGGQAITSRGVCWSLSANPTVADSKTSDGSGSGSFTSSLSGLKSASRIYARAYATNSLGTAYGNQVEFTTLNPVPLAGLVGRWPLDGNAIDVSGKGKNGNIIADPVPTADRFGNANSAYDFKYGTNKIMVSGVDVDLASGGYNTVSLWLNWSGQLYNPNDVGAFIFYWGLTNGGIYLTGRQSWYPEGVETRLGVNAGYGAGETFGVSNAPNLAGNWVHIAVVFKNALAKESTLYINGVKQSSDLFGCCSGLSDFNFVFNATADISIGGWTPAERIQYVLLGKVDDVAVFNRALTSEEILKIYSGSGF